MGCYYSAETRELLYYCAEARWDRSIETVYSTKAAQIIGKAIMRACPNGSLKMKTAVKNIIVGAMY